MIEPNSQDRKYLFKVAQFLGHPSIFPPPAEGKLQASVQFIIPGFKLANRDKKYTTQLAHKCGIDTWGIDAQQVENQRTKETATLVTFAFYVVPKSSEDENHQIVMSTSRLFVVHFLGLLSFFAGMKLSAINIQPTMWRNGGYSAILPVIGRTNMPRVQMEFPTGLESIIPSNDVLSALDWLRRGLAERDPIETFSALMVCLQIIARNIVEQKPEMHSCPKCGAELETRGPSLTSLVRELVVSKLGASPELFKRMWKMRNAVVAHGNEPVTAEVVLELTELKFDAATLAFQGIKLSLGMPLDSPPSPNPGFFATDAYMYQD